jgi:hypothetical protein
LAEQERRAVYRRPGATLFFLVVGLLLLGIAAMVTPAGARDGGWRGALVPWAVAVPAAVMSVLAGALPCLVTTDRHIEVHNLFVRYDIPYRMITDARFGRLGLTVRTASGQRVPVHAFGRSAVANMLTGDAVARRAQAEINERTAGGSAAVWPGAVPSGAAGSGAAGSGAAGSGAVGSGAVGEGDPAVRRHVKTREIAVMAAVLVAAAAILVLA